MVGGVPFSARFPPLPRRTLAKNAKVWYNDLAPPEKVGDALNIHVSICKTMCLTTTKLPVAELKIIFGERGISNETKQNSPVCLDFVSTIIYASRHVDVCRKCAEADNQSPHSGS